MDIASLFLDYVIITDIYITRTLDIYAHACCSIVSLYFLKKNYMSIQPLLFSTSNYIIVTLPSFSPSHTINNLHGIVYILMVTEASLKASLMAGQHMTCKMCAPHLELYVSKTMDACILYLLQMHV